MLQKKMIGVVRAEPICGLFEFSGACRVRIRGQAESQT